MKRLTIVWFGLLLIPISSFIGLRLHYSAQVRDAQRFCEALIPKLEAEQLRTGSYPATLDSILLPSQPLPALLRQRGPLFYKSRGDIYWFLFLEPMAWDNLWIYNSSEKKWMDYDT